MYTAIFYFLLTLLFIFALSQLLCIAGSLLKQPAIEFYGRSIASFLALFLCACYGTIASACLNVAGRGGLGQWTTARAFKWTMYYFTGIWFDVEDEKGWLGRTRPAVLVGNHQTELDVCMIGHVFPRYCSVTAKQSLKYVPVLGWFMALSKTVFIQRTSRTQAFAAFDAAAQQMHKIQQSVYIFPEGTRSYYEHPDMLPFKKGAFHLAIQAQVPIVPVVVGNYSNVLNVKRKIFRPGRIPAKVLEPVETKGKTKDDLPALLDEVREKMLAALKELTDQTRDEGIAVSTDEADARLNGPGKSTGSNSAGDASLKAKRMLRQAAQE